MQLDTVSELEYEFSLRPSDMDDFSEFLVQIKGQAVLWDDGKETVVARLKGHRLDLSIARDQFTELQDLFDCISAEVADLGAHIISGNNCFIECCSRDKEEKTPCSGLLYIDEIVVDPAYRNQKIGTEMLKRMSQIVDMNKTLVALKAVPIIDSSEQRTAELKKQLKHFYSKLGFRHSGEHYMVKDARECHTQRTRALAEQGEPQI